MTTQLKEARLVYVPKWLREIMVTSRLPAAQIIQLPKLLDILTMDDVVFYNATHNALIRSSMLSPFADTFTVMDLILEAKSLDIPQEQLDDMLNKISVQTLVVESSFVDMSGHSDNWEVISQTSNALEYVKDENLKRSRNDFVFDLFEINDNTYGICFSEGTERTYQQCLRESIDMLCKRYPFQEVVQTDLFHSWSDIFN